MDRTVNIGIIGDYDEGASSHPATNAAIMHSTGSLSVKAEITWLPTPSFLTPEDGKKLEEFDAFWVSGGTHLSSDGTINAIQLARKTGKPLIGT